MWNCFRNLINILIKDLSETSKPSQTFYLEWLSGIITNTWKDELTFSNYNKLQHLFNICFCYLNSNKLLYGNVVGYTMADIRYQWNDGLNSVQISNDVSLPQFKVLGHRQKTIEASLSTGNYSRLACEIQFVRSMGYYLIQIYIPSRYVLDGNFSLLI